MVSTLPIPAFGAHAPNALQAMVLAVARLPLLRRGLFRQWFSPLVVALGKEPIDIARGNIRYRLSPSMNVAERGIMLNPLYQDGSLCFLRAKLRQGGQMVDCGANVGQFSLVGGQTVGASGKVLAVEASAEMATRLDVNIVLSKMEGIITVAKVAVGDTEGVLPFEINENDGALSRASATGTHVVPMRPLLKLVEEAGFSRIDLLKIDVEGMEDKVLLPFFRDAPKRMWPEHVIIEDELSDQWDKDMSQFLTGRGYVEAARRTAGNAFFSLQKQDNSDG